MKNSNDTIWNRTSDLPICSTPLWHRGPRMRTACSLSRSTETHSQYVILLLFHYNCGCPNCSQCHVVRTLPALVGFYDLLITKLKSTHFVEKTWAYQLVCSLTSATEHFVGFFVKFGTEFLWQRNSSNKRYFHENRLTESHTLVNVVNEFLVIVSI